MSLCGYLNIIISNLELNVGHDGKHCQLPPLGKRLNPTSKNDLRTVHVQGFWLNLLCLLQTKEAGFMSFVPLDSCKVQHNNIRTFFFCNFALTCCSNRGDQYLYFSQHLFVNIPKLFQAGDTSNGTLITSLFIYKN